MTAIDAKIAKAIKNAESIRIEPDGKMTAEVHVTKPFEGTVKANLPQIVSGLPSDFEGRTVSGDNFAALSSLREGNEVAFSIDAPEPMGQLKARGVRLYRLYATVTYTPKSGETKTARFLIDAWAHAQPVLAVAVSK